MNYTNAREELLYRESSGNSIQVAIIGHGFIGRGLINQILQMKGVRVAAVAGRDANRVANTLKALNRGLETMICSGHLEINRAISEGKTAIVTDPLVVAMADIDVVVDCTGDIVLGAMMCMAAVEEKKHYIAAPEMDAVVGPALKKLADKNGVVYSGYDGDEPGEAMGLFRYVQLLGFEIVAAGKFKGFYDPLYTPDSSRPFAEEYGQNPYKAASFADGTKMSMEMGILANATGLIPDIRGMHCPSGTLETVTEILRPASEGGILKHKGVVEIVRGVEPSAGVFVVAYASHHQLRDDLRYMKMGDGPRYLFYKPYHLCGVEMPFSILKAVLFREAAIAPMGDAVAQVFAVAKRNLSLGEVLDDIGGYTFYGLLDHAARVKEEKLLPAGLAPGARIARAVPAGQPITLEDIESDMDTLLWQLWGKCHAK